MSKKTKDFKPMLIAAAPYVIIGGIALYLGIKLLKILQHIHSNPS